MIIVCSKPQTSFCVFRSFQTKNVQKWSLSGRHWKIFNGLKIIIPCTCKFPVSALSPVNTLRQSWFDIECGSVRDCQSRSVCAYKHWEYWGVSQKESGKNYDIFHLTLSPPPTWQTETKYNRASKVLSDCIIYANSNCWSRKIRMSKYKFHLFEDARNSLLFSFTAPTKSTRYRKRTDQKPPITRHFWLPTPLCHTYSEPSGHEDSPGPP